MPDLLKLTYYNQVNRQESAYNQEQTVKTYRCLFCVFIFPINGYFCNCRVPTTVHVNKEKTDKEKNKSNTIHLQSTD